MKSLRLYLVECVLTFRLSYSLLSRRAGNIHRAALFIVASMMFQKTQDWLPVIKCSLVSREFPFRVHVSRLPRRGLLARLGHALLFIGVTDLGGTVVGGGGFVDGVAGAGQKWMGQSLQGT